MAPPPLDSGMMDDVTFDDLRGVMRLATAPVPPARVPDPEPDVTVSMPAHNAGRYIGDAIRSVLSQTGVGLELIVIDDGSSDDTASVVERLADARIVLLRNGTRTGIGYSHNRATAAARGDFIVHVDADDVILPGALAAAVSALRTVPAAGQAFANHVELNAAGELTLPSFERQRAFLLRHRTRLGDVRRDLLLHGMVANPLRTYRRSALHAVGPFNERLRYAVDYEMTLRLGDRYELLHIPQVLYCARVHGDNTQRNLRLRVLRSWWTRARICEDLLRQRSTLLGFSRGEVRRLSLLGLAYALQLDAAGKRVLRAARLRPRPE
jgi:glycosyltransferase involved in cell wall biosynthesis